jgi:hypothetical protein
VVGQNDYAGHELFPLYTGDSKAGNSEIKEGTLPVERAPVSIADEL